MACGGRPRRSLDRIILGARSEPLDCLGSSISRIPLYFHVAMIDHYQIGTEPSLYITTEVSSPYVAFLVLRLSSSFYPAILRPRRRASFPWLLPKPVLSFEAFHQPAGQSARQGAELDAYHVVPGQRGPDARGDRSRAKLMTLYLAPLVDKVK